MKNEPDRAELNRAAIAAAYLLSRLYGRKLEPLPADQWEPGR